MGENDIATWFGFSRSNYIINPRTDTSFYAPRSRVNIQKIVESLRVNLVTGVPPKRLFWGLYGGGKTHTLFRVAQELEAIMPINKVYVECPNVSKRSTFLHLYHDGIMSSFGQEFVVALFEKLVDEIIKERGSGRPAILSGLQDTINDETLSRAIASLVGADEERKLLFWKFISGVQVPRGDLSGLGQTQDLTSAQPAKLAQVIIIIGSIIRRIHKKTTLLILDELDRLRYVGEDSGSTFEDAFRKLTDDNQMEVAVLMGCSAGDVKSLPEVFGGEYGPILTRIGKTNLIEIPQIDAKDIDDFVKAMIDFVRDKSVDISSMIERAKKEIDETLDVDFFPFTSEAVDKLKGELQRIMTPREVTQRMTQSIGRAFLMGKLAVTRAAI